MAFVTIDDFKNKLYAEIISAVIRNDETVIDVTVAETIASIKTFLGRYNSETIFTATGAARNGQVLKIVKAITLYEIMKLSNRQMPEWIRLDYEDAMGWLNGINSGKYSAGDLPLLGDLEGNTDINSPVQWGSIEKTSYNY